MIVQVHTLQRDWGAVQCRNFVSGAKIRMQQ